MKLLVTLFFALAVVAANAAQGLDADTDKGAHIIQFDGISTPRAVSFKAKLERLDG